MNVIALMFAVMLGAGPGQEDLVAQASTAYKDGDYNRSAMMYEECITRFGENSDIWFNAGNAHFRAGRIGKSVYCYRKSLAADPGNADAEKNLEFARTRRVDRVDETKRGVVDRVIDFMKSSSRMGFTLFTWLGSAALIGIIFGRWRKTASWVIGFAAIGMLSAAGFIAASNNDAKRDLRVVILPKADVYSAPRESLPTLTVHDGIEVDLRRTENGFAEISIGGGTIGWVKAETLSERI